MDGSILFHEFYFIYYIFIFFGIQFRYWEYSGEINRAQLESLIPMVESRQKANNEQGSFGSWMFDTFFAEKGLLANWD